MATDRIKQLAGRAAELIEERGWCQGVPKDERLDLVAAIAEVCAKEDDSGDVLSDPYQNLTLELKAMLSCDSLAFWNDAKGREAKDVINVLNKLAHS